MEQKEGWSVGPVGMFGDVLWRGLRCQDKEWEPGGGA